MRERLLTLVAVPGLLLVAGIVVGRVPPAATAAAVAGAAGIAVAAALVARLRSGIELLLCGVILYLPVAPFATAMSPAGSAVRFALAGLVVVWVLGHADRIRFDGSLLFVGAFVALQLGVLVAGGVTEYSVLRFLNWVMFTPLAAIQYSRREMRVAATSLLLSGGVLLVGVVLQVAGVLGGVWGGLPTGDDLPLELAPRLPRFTSFLLNPNDLGMLSLCVAALLMAVLVGRSRRASPWLLALLGLAASMGLVALSGSRGAILAAVAVLAFLVAGGRRRALAPGLAVLALMAAAPLVLGAFHVDVTLASLAGIITGQDVSATARLQLWASRLSGPEIAFLGSGYGGYAGDMSGVTGSLAGLYQVQTVDSAWLKLFIEEGLVGAGLLGAVVVRAVLGVMRGAAVPETRVAALAVGSMLLALVVRAATADVFDINPWNGLLWIAIGMSFALAPARRASDAVARHTVAVPRGHPSRPASVSFGTGEPA